MNYILVHIFQHLTQAGNSHSNSQVLFHSNIYEQHSLEYYSIYDNTHKWPEMKPKLIQIFV